VDFFPLLLLPLVLLLLVEQKGVKLLRLSYGLSRASCPAGQQNRLGQQKCSGCQPAVHFTGAFLEKYAFQIAINGARVVRPCP
jgi:hypothetical protein